MIMVSGNDPSEDDRKTFLQSGAEDFWVKPVSARQIELLTAGCVTGCHMPAQIWPPRLAIKLLDGATSREKWVFKMVIFGSRHKKKAVALRSIALDEDEDGPDSGRAR